MLLFFLPEYDSYAVLHHPNGSDEMTVADQRRKRNNRLGRQFRCHTLSEVSSFNVTMNQLSISGDGTGAVTRGVKNFIIHPNYNPNTQDNDVALLVLNAPIPNVALVTLPSDTRASNVRAPTTTQTSIKPTVRATTKPTIKPTVRATNKPTTKPAVRATTKPTIKPAVRVTTKPTVRVTTKPTVRVTTKPTMKPTTRTTRKPTTRTTRKPTMRPTTRKPTTRPTTTRPTTRPTTRTTTRTTTKPTTRTTTKPTTRTPTKPTRTSTKLTTRETMKPSTTKRTTPKPTTTTTLVSSTTTTPESSTATTTALESSTTTPESPTTTAPESSTTTAPESSTTTLESSPPTTTTIAIPSTTTTNPLCRANKEMADELTPLSDFYQTIKAFSPYANSPATATGWGTTSSGGNISQVLLKAFVTVLDNSVCSSQYGVRFIGTDMLCASAPGTVSCQGDIGGPLLVGGVQVGITSWGNGCADPNYAGVYTRVTAYVRWIKTAQASNP
ncbi:hypothetical protein OUZ56_019414 [Daphnia magna]|uniref:Peptidase S1 domain-containing protein n=1 Tax=Daphnia magna TaxID=35525 RepID=A0ABQ9ZBI4_9CRUS|nr:hypothetical protein OUZ56_019414 [Daphnia magna]